MSCFLLNSIFSPHFMQLSVICLLVFFLLLHITVVRYTMNIPAQQKKRVLNIRLTKSNQNSQKLKMHKMQIYFPQNTYHRDRLLAILLFIHIVILNQCTSLDVFPPMDFRYWAILCYSVMSCTALCVLPLRYVSMVL